MASLALEDIRINTVEFFSLVCCCCFSAAAAVWAGVDDIHAEALLGFFCGHLKTAGIANNY